MKKDILRFYLKLSSFSSFVSIGICLIRWPSTSNQQPATSNKQLLFRLVGVMPLSDVDSQAELSAERFDIPPPLFGDVAQNIGILP